MRAFEPTVYVDVPFHLDGRRRVDEEHGIRVHVDIKAGPYEPNVLSLWGPPEAMRMLGEALIELATTVPPREGYPVTFTRTVDDLDPATGED